MVEVSQRAREAAADLLDEISDLLDHNGIGQVADLVRDAEYDEHEASQAFAKFEADILTSLEKVKEERDRLRASVNRIDEFVTKYRAPWGSWKTPWWEGEVSDDAAFSDDNAMMHIANIARDALTTKEGE